MRRIARVIPTAALVAAVAFSSPLAAQGRLSLAERVARLEQQQQGQAQNQSSVELLNRLNELQAEVQTLRGLVEQQKFEIEALSKRSRDQYVDLDARLNQLEGRPAGAAPAASAAAPADPSAPGLEPVEPAVAAPPAPGQLAMEEPELAQRPALPSDAIPADEPPPPSVESAARPEDEKGAYDEAFAALRDGRYAESARRFANFLEQHPDGEYADNATYWLGESYYVTQNYEIALDTFQDLLGRFPNSQKAPDALLKIGYCHYELKNPAAAEAALNDVVRRYPDSTVARLAQGRLRALRLETQR